MPSHNHTSGYCQSLQGSEFELDVDTVVVAIGNSPNPFINADEDGRSSKKGVCAGGDAVTGAVTAILAMGAGKKAAAAIHEDLSGT